ncbi:MAG: GAF domain-containing protein, partial [Acidobacteriota bacterium]|nr:GAF domain-containing protein [Acidobacteriota bacterium]
MRVKHNPAVPGQRLGVAMGLATLATLGIWLFYAYVFIARTPYAGIWLHGSWRVEAVEPSAEGRGLIRPGDRILSIGGLSYADSQSDRRRVPFAGFRPGDRVPIRLIRDGREQLVEWPLPGPTLRAIAKRLAFFVPVFILWFLGSLAWFVLRPRNETWALVILFHHVTAVWLALGPMSVYCTAWSSLMLHGVTWLMAPVYLHLHLVLPTPLLARRTRYHFLAVLYGLAGVFVVLELFQVLPFTAYFIGFLTAVLGSLVLLVLRWWVRRAPAERQATRLMTTGLLLAFGPLLIIHASFLLTLKAYIELSTMIFLVLLVPVLPMFYAYGAFKRYLGAMEVRANRLLGLYSFGLLYVTVYLLVLLPSRWWFDTPPGMLLYSLGTSAVFVLAAPALQARFQRLFNRIAYGARHDPTELLILFTQRIPMARDQRTLVDMLADEMLPTLFIRQSALYIWEEGSYSLVYSRGISLNEKETLPDRIPGLLTEAGRYRAPFPGTPAEKDWVRLVIPLRVQDRWMGVWLLGGRDPDDFYPQADVDLLTALASQVAIGLENARMYADLQQRARQLQTLYDRTRFTQFAVDHASDAALWVDDRGRITYANHVACRLLGQTPEAVIGVRFRDLRLEVPEVT